MKETFAERERRERFEALLAAHREIDGGFVRRPLSMDEAIELAKHAQVLVQLASELLYLICCQESLLPRDIQSSAYRREKEARDTALSIGCNYAGLPDTIKRYMTTPASSAAREEQ